MNRVLRIAVGLALSPFATLAASALGGSDSTTCGRPADASQPRTLFKDLGLNAAHFDLGESVRLGDGMSGVAQQRVVLSFCRWDGVSFGLTYGVGGGLPFNTGEALDVTRDDPHRATLSLRGAEVQWRFGDTASIHPLVSVAAGQMLAGWQYALATPPVGVTRPNTDPRSSTSYAASAVGAEFNLFKYVRADLMAGARVMGALATPGLASHPLQGPFISASLAFGKF